MLDSIKSILIGITEEGKDEPSSAIGYGLSLAGAARAHLTVQATSLKLDVPYSFISGFGSNIVACENHRLEALAAVVAERVRTDAAMEHVGCTTEVHALTYEQLLAAFVRQARVQDLSILDAEASDADIDRDLIEAVLFRTGRPVIVVPLGRETFSCRRITVAWDGSASAARAVADSMPFLRAAEKVEIVSVTDDKDLSKSVSSRELAPHLERHGVKVTVKELTTLNGDTAETLRHWVATMHADMLVMGSFKRARLTEWVLGGVTQSLLRRCAVPLFMSH